MKLQISELALPNCVTSGVAELRVHTPQISSHAPKIPRLRRSREKPAPSAAFRPIRHSLHLTGCEGQAPLTPRGQSGTRGQLRLVTKVPHRMRGATAR